MSSEELKPCNEPQAHPDRCGCQPDAFQIARHSKRLVEQQRERIVALEAENARLLAANLDCVAHFEQMRAQLAAIQGGTGEVVEVVAYLLPDYAISRRLSTYSERKIGEPLMTLAQHQRITAAMAAEVETWRSNALMLEQANVGLAQLNGKLRAELAEVKGREAVGEVQLRTGGGISLLHVDLTQPLPPGTKLYTAPQPAPAQDVAGLASSDPVAKAEFETRLRKEFESRWPKPKGVTWGAGINDYCVSEFAEGIALSYPDMWMAYKAGAMRTNQ